MSISRSRWRAVGAARSVRLRQDHAAADHRRAGLAGFRRGRDRRRERADPRRQRAPGRLRVPALRAVPPHDGVRERRLRPARAAARDPQGRGDDRARVKELLDLVQLDWLANRYPSQLSGGQRQRIALGVRWRSSRASCCSTSRSARSMPRCARSSGNGCVRCTTRSMSLDFVTHDQEEALEVANRVVVMDKGKIEQIGSPGEVYDNPATPSCTASSANPSCCRSMLPATRCGSTAAPEHSGSGRRTRRVQTVRSPPRHGDRPGRHWCIGRCDPARRSFGPIQRAEVTLSAARARP